ncbi:alpha/beta hydrolase [Paucibacter sp. KBW04]|uniref:alpha/beta fold hydrolase n=1 Tax=Paucibacter sp. KBW04 TaxID=2153361 RepID=UPI000F58015A|nr:alpha/beta hydrolase [Paucibacter sp. KBW04]RQO54320.1 alpha/beta hydrolase [Paucibacter sp. KBW04]
MFSKPSTSLARLLAPASLALAAALALQAPAQAAAEPGQIGLSVRGSGMPVLMIPGLSSSAQVWDETCAALQPQVQCLIAQLPGFAGAPAGQQQQAQFLEAMRDQLQALIKAQAPKRVTVMGHSLGGALALMLAAQADAAQIERLIIVDSLPFLPAIQNPNATVESVRPQMAAMRDAMSKGKPQAAQLKPMMASMSKSPARVEQLVQWGLDSDPATVAQAMYELWTTDLRPLLPKIKVPTLVFGAWAAYAPMGSSQEIVTRLYQGQYAALEGVQIKVSQAGYHFLMWDDPALVQQSTREFMGLARMLHEVGPN